MNPLETEGDHEESCLENFFSDENFILFFFFLVKDYFY